MSGFQRVSRSIVAFVVAVACLGAPVASAQTVGDAVRGDQLASQLTMGIAGDATGAGDGTSDTSGTSDATDAADAAGTADLPGAAQAAEADALPGDKTGVPAGMAVSAASIAIALKMVDAETGKDVAGAVSEVRGIFADSNGAIVTRRVNGGEAIADLLIGAPYTLTGTTPGGYEMIPGTIRFVVNEDGTITQTDNTSNGEYAISDDGLTLTVTNTPIRLRLIKRGSGSDIVKHLSGAEFTLTGTFIENGQLVTYPKDDGSTLTVTDTEFGTLHFVQGAEYTLTETKAPAGYELIEGTLEFTVNPKGEMTVTKRVDGYSMDEESRAEYTANDDRIEITLAKVDEQNQPLKGATFMIEGTFVDPSDTTSATTTTTPQTITLNDDAASATVTNLIAGEYYTVTETDAPAGYRMIGGSFRFHVETDGTVVADQTSEVTSGEVTVSEDGLTITAKDEPTDLTIVKKNEDGTKKLGGAVFTVTPLAVTLSSFATLGTGAQTLTTEDESGKASLIGELVVGHVYEIRETAAPAGYIKAEGSLYVKVLEDGSLAAVRADGTEDPDDVVSVPDGFSLGLDGTLNVVAVNVENHSTQLNVRKVSSSDSLTPLAGATFTLSGVFTDPTLSEQTLTTDAEGRAALSKALLRTDGTVYTLRETAAPAGYELNAYAFTFTVAADGTITPTNSTEAAAAGYAVGDDGVTVTSKGVPIELALVKHGSNSGDRALDGAEFTVTGKFRQPDGTVAAEEETKTGVTVDEFAALRFVQDENYTIIETKAPAGYELIPYQFSIDVLDDGEIVEVETVDGYEINRDSVTITVTDPAITGLRLVKNGADGAQNLTGAQFALTGTLIEDGAETTYTETDPLTVDTGSFATLQFIQNESYTMWETVAPQGYRLVTDRFTFTMTESGTITATNTDTDMYTVSDDGLTLTATDPAFSIALVNQDADGNTLDGAQFDVTGKFCNDDGTVAERATTVSVDVTGFAGLRFVQNESYTITETQAPLGYELIGGTFGFAVGADGTLAATTPADGYAIDDGTPSITVTGTAIALSLAKVGDNTDGQTLTGAEFALTGTFIENGKTVEHTADNPLTNVTVDEFATLHFVQDTNYTITETTAPAGYELIPYPFEFHVHDDGEIWQLEPTHGYRIDRDSVTITVTDPAIRVALAKQSTDGEELTGAEFALTGTFIENGEETTYTEDNPRVVTPGTIGELQFIQNTQYTLRETTAPAGYELIGDPFTFTVGADGTITATSAIADTGTAGYTVNADGITITATDAAIELSLSKRGSDQTADAADLTGALFTVKGEFRQSDGSVKQEEHAGVTVTDFATLRFVQGATYELTETAAPLGYELIGGTLKFTVGTDGTITLADGATLPEGYAIDDGNVAITATDTPIAIDLTKTDADGEALAGATFEITGEFADGTGSRTVSPTDDPASTTITGLVANRTYAVSETAAPAGYAMIIGSFTFTVQADGTVAALNTTGITHGTVTLSDDGLTIIAADEPTSLAIVKKNEDGTRLLEGAVFAVTPAEGSAFADGTTDAKSLDATGTDGTTGLVGQLVVGNTYEIAEITAPDGYVLLDQTLTITVSETGQIVAVGEVPSAFGKQDDGTLVIVTGDVANDPTKLNLLKVSAEDPLLKLAGAEFTLAGEFADGSDTKTLTSGETGSAALDTAMLIADGETVYSLSETTASAGYELIAEPFAFTVATDGRIVPVDTDSAAADSAAADSAAADAAAAATAGYSVGGDGNITITAADQPIAIDLVKVDATVSDETGAPVATPLANAVFEVAGEFADGSDAQQLVTDADGIASIRALLVAGREYTLTETTAPDGYELIAAPLTFTVGTDGTITVTNADEAAAAGYALSEDRVRITASGVPTELRLVKHGSDKPVANLLAGAEFTVTPAGDGDRFTDASDAETLTVGANGETETLTGQLIVGHRYVIAETKAPAGYELLAEPLTVEINADGTLTPVAPADANGETADGGAGAAGVSDGGDGGAADGDVAGSSDDGAAGSSDDGAVVTDDGAADGGKVDVDGDTAMPQGYAITADGTVAVVEATDQRIELGMVKVNAKGDPLAGAVFEIRGLFADGSDTRTVRSGEDGTMALVDMVAGETYTVRETAAPADYRELKATATITVQSDGTMTLAEGADPSYSLAEDGLTLTVVNEPVPGSPADTGSNVSNAVGVAVMLLMLGGVTLAVRRSPTASRRGAHTSR